MAEVQSTLGSPDAFGPGTIRYKIDIGWRWIIQPVPFDLVIRFGKGNEVSNVVIEPEKREAD
jgi:hypothetical protein